MGRFRRAGTDGQTFGRIPLKISVVGPFDADTKLVVSLLPKPSVATSQIERQLLTQGLSRVR